MTSVSVQRINEKQSERKRTPTSRYRTSRHSAPKSFIRCSASSRKFPEFSHPLVTSGRGISLPKSSANRAQAVRSAVDPTFVRGILVSMGAPEQEYGQQRRQERSACSSYISLFSRARIALSLGSQVSDRSSAHQSGMPGSRNIPTVAAVFRAIQISELTQ